MYSVFSNRACVLVDSEGDSIGITIYNVSSTCHFSIGDILTVPDLKLTHTHIQDMVSHSCSLPSDLLSPSLPSFFLVLPLPLHPPHPISLLPPFIFPPSVPASTPLILHFSQGVEYDNIRLTQPQKILCNGVPLPQDKLSTSVAQVTTFS